MEGKELIRKRLRRLREEYIEERDHILPLCSEQGREIFRRCMDDQIERIDRQLEEL